MDPTTALQALVIIIGEDDLRDRFMALTGLDAATLRARAGQPDMTLAISDFLAGNERDLLRVATALAIPPEKLL